MTEETYKHEEKCDNCKNINKLTIPKGIKIKDFLKDKECWKCGCKINGGEK